MCGIGVVSTVLEASSARGISPPVNTTVAGGGGGLGTLQSSARLKGVVPSKVIQVKPGSRFMSFPTAVFVAEVAGKLLVKS